MNRQTINNVLRWRRNGFKVWAIAEHLNLEPSFVKTVLRQSGADSASLGKQHEAKR